jgi:leucyl-tRNA synthetase
VLGFNTAIAQMMVFVNELYKVGTCPREYAEGFVKMISCITPHVGEEIWQSLGHDGSIAFEVWPTYDESKCVEDTVEIALQVNGKIRNRIEVAADIAAADAIAAAKADERVASALAGMQIVKELYVPGKLVNLVVKPQ